MKDKIFFFIIFLSICVGCGQKLKENTDKVYSRHLQKYIDITIISTPAPTDKNDFNLLLLNDGANLKALHVKDITASLNKKKLIKPLVIIGINTLNNKDLFGLAGKADYLNRGMSSEKYANFIINELLPFVKKKAGVRKFATVTLAGFSTGGLSAFDISWDNWQKFDKVGIFSGDFNWSDLDQADPLYQPEKNDLTLNKIRTSRKRPKLKYWFYAGGKGDKAPESGNTVILNTRELIPEITKKKIVPPGDITYQEKPEEGNDKEAWGRAFPDFLIWVAGK